MERIKDKIKEDNMEFEAWKCTSCGEELVNMEQLKALATKYRKLRQAREVTFAKWGNSLAVRIPTEIVEELKIKPGKHALLNTEDEAIKITPV